MHRAPGGSGDSRHWSTRLATALALRRGTVGILAMICLVGLGERMAERFLPIYLLALGAGPWVIGALQAMDNLLSALYSFPGGYLSDRIGPQRALVVFHVVAMIGFALVIAIPSWPAVLIGAVFFLSWSAVSSPATMSLLYRLLPRDRRTMGVSLVALARRIPKALGPLLGGFLIVAFGERDGVRAAFAVALVLALFGLVLQRRLIRAEDVRTPVALGLPERNPLRLWRRMDPALKRLLFSDVLIRFCEQIPYAFVVVWCMKVIERPVTATQFGWLTVLEMAIASVVYLPVAHFADRTEKKPFVLVTFLFFTLFPIVLLFSHSIGWLVVAFVVRGLKEFGDATRKALILDLSPEDCRAGMYGLYYLVRDVIVAVAAFAGAFLWLLGPEVNLLTAAGFGLVGTLVYAATPDRPTARSA